MDILQYSGKSLCPGLAKGRTAEREVLKGEPSAVPFCLLGTGCGDTGDTATCCCLSLGAIPGPAAGLRTIKQIQSIPISGVTPQAPCPPQPRAGLSTPYCGSHQARGARGRKGTSKVTELPWRWAHIKAFLPTVTVLFSGEQLLIKNLL